MQGDVVKLFGIDVVMQATGSRVICDPAPTDTDEDWIVLVAPEKFDEFWEHLIADGFELGGSELPEPAEADETIYNYGCFNSFKKGDLNYIVTTNQEFFDNFDRATVLAKALNLVNKDGRITLFQVFLYDNWDFAGMVGMKEGL